ncbi:MAG: hypothetical protein O3B13_04655 [Planctomycetota bacterium]|nr:hypothetical protein [Planctomycetota bacterium]
MIVALLNNETEAGFTHQLQPVRNPAANPHNTARPVEQTLYRTPDTASREECLARNR